MTLIYLCSLGKEQKREHKLREEIYEIENNVRSTKPSIGLF